MKNQTQIPVLIAVLLAITLMALPGCKKNLFDVKPEPTPEEIRNAAQNALRDSIIGKTWQPFARVDYVDNILVRIDTVRNCLMLNELRFTTDSLFYVFPYSNSRCSQKLDIDNARLEYGRYSLAFHNSERGLVISNLISFGADIRPKGEMIELVNPYSPTGVFGPSNGRRGYLFKKKD